MAGLFRFLKVLNRDSHLARQELLHQCAFLGLEGGEVLGVEGEFAVGGGEDFGDGDLLGECGSVDVELKEVLWGDVEKAVGSTAFMGDAGDTSIQGAGLEVVFPEV